MNKLPQDIATSADSGLITMEGCGEVRKKRTQLLQIQLRIPGTKRNCVVILKGKTLTVTYLGYEIIKCHHKVGGVFCDRTIVLVITTEESFDVR